MLDSLIRSRGKELADYISTLAYISEIKEWDNRTHLERIRRMTLILSLGMGNSQDESEAISLASQLHDIGKSATPDELLKKAGNYSEAEWSIVERHTSDGAAILAQSTTPLLLLGSSIALTHHERWDGSGYPSKLVGSQIPLGGQICAIADVFDALTTPRSYKHMISPLEALEMILKSGGSLFSLELVKVFEQKFNEIEKIHNLFH